MLDGALSQEMNNELKEYSIGCLIDKPKPVYSAKRFHDIFDNKGKYSRGLVANVILAHQNNNVKENKHYKCYDTCLYKLINEYSGEFSLENKLFLANYVSQYTPERARFDDSLKILSSIEIEKVTDKKLLASLFHDIAFVKAKMKVHSSEEVVRYYYMAAKNYSSSENANEKAGSLLEAVKEMTKKVNISVFAEDEIVKAMKSIDELIASGTCKSHVIGSFYHTKAMYLANKGGLEDNPVLISSAIQLLRKSYDVKLNNNADQDDIAASEKILSELLMKMKFKYNIGGPDVVEKALVLSISAVARRPNFSYDECEQLIYGSVVMYEILGRKSEAVEFLKKLNDDDSMSANFKAAISAVQRRISSNKE